MGLPEGDSALLVLEPTRGEDTLGAILSRLGACAAVKADEACGGVDVSGADSSTDSSMYGSSAGESEVDDEASDARE